MLALWKFAARVRWLRPDTWPMLERPKETSTISGLACPIPKSLGGREKPPRSKPRFGERNQHARRGRIYVIDKDRLNHQSMFEQNARSENACSFVVVRGRGCSFLPASTLQISFLKKTRALRVRIARRWVAHLQWPLVPVQRRVPREVRSVYILDVNWFAPPSASSGATNRSASTSVRKRARSISFSRSTSYMFFMAAKLGQRWP